MIHIAISNSSSGIWTMILTWTPTATQSGPQGFCAGAIDNSGLQSDPYCITFLVNISAVSLIQSSATPVGNILQNQTVFQIQADASIFPPTRNSTYIYFNDATINTVVQSFDCGWAPEVTYTGSSVIIQFPVAPWIPAHSYYVTFDSGVASGGTYCHVESAPISSPTFWTFTVLPSTTTTTTTTISQTTELLDYSCTENDVSIQFALLSSSHTAWNPISNCSLQQCNASLINNNNCLSSSTPCFDYRTINNISYCAPAILCSILETCDNITQTCSSNDSVCVINSCCSPQAVCLPLLATQMCKTGWFYTSSMNDARSSHTASVLSNGKVLVVGGADNSGSLNSAELYDPSSGTWTTTGNMTDARKGHTASVLSNGKVLVTGGYGNGYLNSAELYDPSSGTWTTTGNMNNVRIGHTASILLNGKVLVTGGEGIGYITVNSTELYDLSTGIWTATGSMNDARYLHAASVLSNGLVLVTGGEANIGGLNSAELYDPSTGTWTTTNNMTDARYTHTASLLSNGKVLVTGGWNGYIAMNSVELYDPSISTWTTTGNTNNGRSLHTASVLSNGKVLVTGGWNFVISFNSTELYDPSSGTWTTTGNMNNARVTHTASVLSNGLVLLTGGVDNSGILNSAELY
ncbi:unnamed protein product [Adineta steineri]|uniref:Attractin/MKLN-like beta-propeller domain-containing protein n=1 Tax=Adineta steineri TaxID=433720 RepID=A0A819ZDN9_9BILA|nr:unnamed protein product [Adineta steineri]